VKKVRNRSSLKVVTLDICILPNKITKTIQMGSSSALEFGDGHQILNFEAHSGKLVTMTLAGQEKLGSPMAIPQAPNGAAGSFSPNTVRRGKG